MSTSLFSLAGKVAIVTGGSKGLGYEMARTLALAGADVAITSRSEEEVCSVAETLASETGRRVLGIRADAGVETDVQSMAERTVAQLGGIDILVNNAGVNRHSFVEDQSEEDWNAVLQIDLTGPMLCTKAVVKPMQARGGGRIVNISSVFGLVGYVKRGAYCASKGALVNLTRCYAVELAPHGITVNCVCPGPVDTPMTRRLVTGASREDFTSRIPLGRWGTPEELGAAVLYFASGAAAWTTGAVLAVDGGWTAQ